MKLVKDRGRMEQLAAGGVQAPSRLRDVEMEEMMEELQEKVRGLQAENGGLKQRLLVAKQQLLSSQGHRPSPYGHVLPRVNSGLKKFRDNMSSPSQMRPRSESRLSTFSLFIPSRITVWIQRVIDRTRVLFELSWTLSPAGLRSLDEAGRPPTGLLPRYGHSLLEEARAEIRNLWVLLPSRSSESMQIYSVNAESAFYNTDSAFTLLFFCLVSFLTFFASNPF